MEEVSSSEPTEISAFKSKLFTYAQKHGFDHPNYHFKNEGFPHAPCLRVTVDVAGHTFTAPKTFKRRKDAEYFISKLAFESLSHQAPAYVISSSFLEGSKLCKTILNEYCMKKGTTNLPSYNTKVPESGPSTVFVSKVMFDNNVFVGPLSKSKKEAEQSAAHVVITALLDNSETRCMMSEVIQKILPASAASAESNPIRNTKPNDNAVSYAESIMEPAEVAEKNSLVSTSFWIVPSTTCKSILNEYLNKKVCQDLPLYRTHTNDSGSLEAFISSVTIEGNTYYGPPSKSKKEAEQAAACVAIKSILGNPVAKNFMLQAMQSKIKLDPSWNVNLISGPCTDPNPNDTNTSPHQVVINHEAKIIGDSTVTPMESLPHVALAVPAGQNKLVMGNPSLVQPNKSARKRVRIQQNLEDKKVKIDC